MFRRECIELLTRMFNTILENDGKEREGMYWS